MRLGLIARMDKSGLANQTRNLAYMLKPSKIMVIDSTLFNKNDQYPETYEGFNAYRVNGFPSRVQYRTFMRGLDAIISCETFYNSTVVNDAKQLGVKTFLQYNYEFLDNLLPRGAAVPDVFISPSYWKLDEMKQLFNNVVYLPPPTDARTFTKARNNNFARDGKKFLHIVGKPAVNDRNGTVDLIEALKYTDADFELHIKAQVKLDIEVNDSRVHFDYRRPTDESELYDGYDAMILPRRYAGLCLPMNEALMSGLPVIMSDIEPNNKILPKKWLVYAKKKSEFMTRTMIDLHETDHLNLARKLDWLCRTDLNVEKAEAFELGYNNYSVETLKSKYEELLS